MGPALEGEARIIKSSNAAVYSVSIEVNNTSAVKEKEEEEEIKP